MWTNAILRRLVTRAPTATAALSVGTLREYSRERRRDYEKAHRPVYLWGSNAYGLVQPALLSDSAADRQQRPLVLRQPRECTFWQQQGLGLRAVSGSDRHACAVDTNGDLWQWGEDFLAGEDAPQKTLQGKKLRECVCTDQLVLAVSTEGVVWAVPVAKGPSDELAVIVSSPERVRKLACGHDHMVAVGHDGSLLAGALNDSANWYGQLGVGVVDSHILQEGGEERRGAEDRASKDVVLDWPREKPIIATAMKEEDRLCQERRLHYPHVQLFKVSSPRKPSLLQSIFRGQSTAEDSAPRWVDAACGSHHSVAVDEHGRAYTWGLNSNQQLGLGGNNGATEVATPTVVAGLPPVRAVAAAGSTTFFHTVAASADDGGEEGEGRQALYACGNGLYGQLGIGGWHHAVGQPRIVPTVSGQTYYDEAAKKERPLAIRALWVGPSNASVLMDTYHHVSGGADDTQGVGYDLLVWGSNKHHQLSATTHANVPRPATYAPPSPTMPSVDERDLALSAQGPTSTAPRGGLSFLGGQLQVLPAAPDDPHPSYAMHMGPEFSCLY